MLQQEYQAAQRTRYIFLAIILIGLAMEAIGAVLLFQGRPAEGFAFAIAGLFVWVSARFFGMRTYTRQVARMRVRYGMDMKDAGEMTKDEAMSEMPASLILPPDYIADRPLVVYPLKGHWQGYPVSMAELTVGFHTKSGSRQYMSGTIAFFTSDRVASKWLAIYGKPYGGIPVSRWTGWTPTDNGERGFLLLSDEQSEPRDDQANAFSAFDPGREKLAVLRTEPGRVIAFLPRQFYSGTWSLSKPMPEKEAQANPLPALEELPKLLKKLV